MANPFVHVELNTGDPAKAKEFYSRVFGWQLQDMPMGPGMTYTMIDVGEGVGGGIQKKPMADAPTMWLSYVQVDSVKQTIAKAADGGARIIVAEQPIPGMGTLGIFLDPEGAPLGIWEPAAKPKPAKKKKKKAARRKPAAEKKAARKKPAAKKKAARKKPAAKKRAAREKPAAKKRTARKKPAAKKKART